MATRFVYVDKVGKVPSGNQLPIDLGFNPTPFQTMTVEVVTATLQVADATYETIVVRASLAAMNYFSSDSKDPVLCVSSQDTAVASGNILSLNGTAPALRVGAATRMVNLSLENGNGTSIDVSSGDLQSFSLMLKLTYEA